MPLDDQEHLAELLRQTLIRRSRVPLAAIRDEDVLTRDLGFDSFALLNVILDLEDRFSIEIDPARLAGLRQIDFQGFVMLVAEHLAGKKPDGDLAATE